MATIYPYANNQSLEGETIEGIRKMICPRCLDVVGTLYPAGCDEKPEKMKGHPIDHYRCPDCGTELKVGEVHPELCRRCVDGVHPVKDMETSMEVSKYSLTKGFYIERRKK